MNKNYLLKIDCSFLLLNSINQKIFLLLFFTIFPIINSLAATTNNKSFLSYFYNNIIFRIIVSGGYYSLATISVLVVLSIIYKKFREIILSILFAIIGIFLLVFLYEALEDFQWIT